MFNFLLFRLVTITGLLFIIFADIETKTETKWIKSAKVDFVTLELSKPEAYNQLATFNQSETNLVPNSTKAEFRGIITDKGAGRGHLRKRKKFLKFMYPLLMAALFAKLVVVPLFLKLLIATTSSAFVMSKIALVISALIALSWLLGATRERAKLQIVQYPGPSGSKKNLGGWNVQDKYSPEYDGGYNSWAYDDAVADNNDKHFFI
ncbi:uncharacterized protein LOC129942332 [Eupeodes corollae]|uniref:uncharacterized protein LOC129942332 n=1 Tax=Eupeodes corollae TaxID=290404 RepID=UPI002492F799|nr:uncharacterized protein LOC129942332 [Eupeodes corollae]